MNKYMIKIFGLIVITATVLISHPHQTEAVHSIDEVWMELCRKTQSFSAGPGTIDELRQQVRGFATSTEAIKNFSQDVLQSELRNWSGANTIKQFLNNGHDDFQETDYLKALLELRQFIRYCDCRVYDLHVPEQQRNTKVSSVSMSGDSPQGVLSLCREAHVDEPWEEGSPYDYFDNNWAYGFYGWNYDRSNDISRAVALSQFKRKRLDLSPFHLPGIGPLKLAVWMESNSEWIGGNLEYTHVPKIIDMDSLQKDDDGMLSLPSVFDLPDKGAIPEDGSSVRWKMQSCLVSPFKVLPRVHRRSVVNYYDIYGRERANYLPHERPRSDADRSAADYFDGVSVIGEYGVLYMKLTDLSLPGKSPNPEISLTFRRFYDSQQKADLSSPMGSNWNHNHNVKCRYYNEIPWQNPYVIIKDPSGREHKYKRMNDGEYEYCPQFINDWEYAVLEETDSGLLWRHPYGIEYDFIGEAGMGIKDFKLKEKRDHRGNALHYEYSGERLIAIKDDGGRRLSLSYSGGHISTLTDPCGNVTKYKYSGNALISYTDAEGQKTEYKYGQAVSPFLVTGITDPKGNEITFKYRLQKDLEMDGDRWNPSQIKVRYIPELKKIILPDGSETIFQTTLEELHQNLGCTVTSPGGGITAVFNESNRPCTQKRYGEDDIYLERDDKGNITAYTDSSGSRYEYIYDSSGNITQYIDAEGGITEYVYDSEYNIVTEVIDPLGRKTENILDEKGNIIKTIDAAGNKTKYTYTKTGKLLSLTDAQGNTEKNEYDLLGNLIRRTDKLGNSTTYEYDLNGNCTAETDPLGNRTAYEYDRNNRLTKTTYADGSETSIVYDGNGNKQKETDENGNTTEYVYDNRNLLQKKIDPLGNVTEYTYNESGDLISTKSPTGKVEEHEYSGFSKPVALKAASGRHVIGYGEIKGAPHLKNGKWLPSSIKDELGGKQTFTYNRRYQIRKQTDQIGRTIKYSYDAAGNKTFQTDANGNCTEYKYDRLNRVTQKTNPLGEITQIEYDILGRITKQTDPCGNEVTFKYDTMGRIIERTDELGFTIKTTYDANGNKISMTDERGNTTHYQYDLRNRLIKVTEPGEWVTTRTYDKKGNLISLTRPDGNTTEYEYDECDRLKKKINADNTVTEFAYDASGNRLSVKEGSEIIRYEYEYYERLFSVIKQHNLIRYSYDRLGRRTGVEIDGRYIESGFDAAGQQISINIDPQKQIKLEYDNNGNIIKKTYPNGVEIEYLYDGLNRVSLMSTSTGIETRYEYDKSGNLIKKQENSDITEYIYDKKSRLIKTVYPDGSIEETEYDAAGNRTLHSRGDQTETYIYTEDNRLIERNVTGGESSGSGKVKVRGKIEDDNGIERVLIDGIEAEIVNGEYIAEVAVSPGENTVYLEAMDVAGKTTEKEITLTYWADDNGHYEYEYNANGSLTRIIRGDSETRIKYNANNRATGIYSGEEYKLEYSYDSDNRITAIRESGKAEQLNTYDGLHRLKEEKPSEGIEDIYINGERLDEVMAKINKKLGETEKIFYYVQDVQGSILEVTDAGGSIINKYKYESWGEERVEKEGLEERRGYTGREKERSFNLMNYRARLYDPKLGRFLQKDPITGGPDDPGIQYKNERYAMLTRQIKEQTDQHLPHGPNRYIYCQNTPTKYTDPLGLIIMESKLLLDYLHYDLREYLNRDVPKKKPESGFGYSRVYEADYHQQGPGNENNIKMVSFDGHKEAIYNNNDELVLDSVNKGTYNYAAPCDYQGHFVFDMVPYYFFGNTRDDPTTFYERVTASYGKEKTQNKVLPVQPHLIALHPGLGY